MVVRGGGSTASWKWRTPPPQMARTKINHVGRCHCKNFRLGVEEDAHEISQDSSFEIAIGGIGPKYEVACEDVFEC